MGGGHNKITNPQVLFNVPPCHLPRPRSSSLFVAGSSVMEKTETLFFLQELRKILA
jgi:hypothetical protein